MWNLQGSKYLKQVKDAIAEANNQHASVFVEVYSCDVSAPLVEEVFGSESPSSTCR